MTPVPTPHLHGPTVTVHALGVPVGVDVGLADRLPTFSRSTATPIARVDPHSLDPIREFTHRAVTHTELLAFHAGVVEGADGAVAVPGRSGVGKSTLVAACVAAGLTYLSDEVLALDPADQGVVPFPRPLALSAASRAVVGIADAEPGELFVPVEELGAVSAARTRLRHVVIPRRGAGPSRLVPVDPSELVGELLARSFNHFRYPGPTWTTLVALAARVQVWEAHYEDATVIARDLARLGDGRRS